MIGLSGRSGVLARSMPGKAGSLATCEAAFAASGCSTRRPAEADDDRHRRSPRAGRHEDRQHRRGGTALRFGQRREERGEDAVGEQAEAAEVGEARALAEAGEAGDVEARLEPVEGEGAVEAQLGPRLALPDRPDARLQFGPHRLGEEAAQLGQEVEAGAVDDVLVVGDRRPGGGLQRQLDPLPLARRSPCTARPSSKRSRCSPASRAITPASKTPRSQCLMKSWRASRSSPSQPTSSGSAKTRFSRKLSPRLSGSIGV